MKADIKKTLNAIHIISSIFSKEMWESIRAMEKYYSFIIKPNSETIIIPKPPRYKKTK